MNKANEITALLDKAVFAKIRITAINDMGTLIRRGILEVNEKSPVKYVTESGQEFSRLHIKNDELFSELSAGAMLKGNGRVDFCSFNTSIGNKETSNLICYTVEQYAERLRQIQERLETEYGIITDFRDISLKEIEINRTFKLEDDFEKYHRPITLIMHNLPYPYMVQMETKRKKAVGTYYAKTSKTAKSKDYAVFKIYDKSKSVEKVIELKENYMRVEIRLTGFKKIRKSLGTVRYDEITDEIINTYFDTQMMEMIVIPYEKWKKKRDNQLKRLITSQYIDNPKGWKKDVLTHLLDREVKHEEKGDTVYYCPVLLDVSELMPFIDNIEPDKDRRYNRKNALRETARKMAKAFCNNDHKRLEEIIAKIS